METFAAPDVARAVVKSSRIPKSCPYDIHRKEAGSQLKCVPYSIFPTSYPPIHLSSQLLLGTGFRTKDKDRNTTVIPQGAHSLTTEVGIQINKLQYIMKNMAFSVTIHLIVTLCQTLS